MRLYIEHQPSYSRLELLLRTFFGFFYIGIPHGIVLYLLGLVAAILNFITFFAILFTGKYPQSMFDFQKGFMAWGLRVQARFFHLVDGYPPFGLEAPGDKVQFDITNPPSLSRLLLLLKVFLGGFYVGIPHGFCLFFRFIVGYVLFILAWFAVLFTGHYPASFHSFNVGTIRWATRVQTYMNMMTDQYPPFSGAE